MARAKRALEPTEAQIQSAFVDWARLHERIYPALRLAFAVPNGELRHPAVAKRLKRLGVRPGVPDWILPVPRDAPGSFRRCGLMIEFKARTGRLSVAQHDYIQLAHEVGWECHLARSTEEAIQIVIRYLADK